MDAAKTLGKTLVASPERQVEADSDMDIVRRVQGGDVAAFDQLIVKYRVRVYSVIYNLTSNREDAADLTQDAFIKSFQSINRFQGQSSFFTWLYRIAVNSTLTHLRKNRLRTFFSFEKINEDDQVSSEVIAALTDDTGADRETFARAKDPVHAEPGEPGALRRGVEVERHRVALQELGAEQRPQGGLVIVGRAQFLIDDRPRVGAGWPHLERSGEREVRLPRRSSSDRLGARVEVRDPYGVELAVSVDRGDRLGVEGHPAAPRRRPKYLRLAATADVGIEAPAASSEVSEARPS